MAQISFWRTFLIAEFRIQFSHGANAVFATGLPSDLLSGAFVDIMKVESFLFDAGSHVSVHLTSAVAACSIGDFQEVAINLVDVAPYFA